MTEEKTKKDKTRYIEAVGRRKTAVARVRITEADKSGFVVNDKDVSDYFPTEELQMVAHDAVSKSKTPAKFSVSALIKGGGIHAQAEALRYWFLYTNNSR